MTGARHQYVERDTGAVLDEELFGDRIVRFLYSPARERAPALFKALTGPRMSGLLAYANFDARLGPSLLGNRRFLRRAGVDLDECVDPPGSFTTPRRIFERRIRYWECRPQPADPRAVVCPADARVLLGSLEASSGIFVKEKFFSFGELLGTDSGAWLSRFASGDFAVFRLTPDKYHYNHTPVAGRVVAATWVDGNRHSCNPAAVVQVVTPYSKNGRFVTIFDTDVPGGTGAGLVAMVEVVALMIGGVEQRYSERRYDDPRPLKPGMFVERGCPKSLYRPGSSTDVLLFEPGRIAFAPDLLRHQSRTDVASRFSEAFAGPLCETEVRVRSWLGRAMEGAP